MLKSLSDCTHGDSHFFSDKCIISQQNHPGFDIFFKFLNGRVIFVAEGSVLRSRSTEAGFPSQNVKNPSLGVLNPCSGVPKMHVLLGGTKN